MNVSDYQALTYALDKYMGCPNRANRENLMLQMDKYRHAWVESNCDVDHQDDCKKMTK